MSKPGMRSISQEKGYWDVAGKESATGRGDKSKRADGRKSRNTWKHRWLDSRHQMTQDMDRSGKYHTEKLGVYPEGNGTNS